MWFAIGSQHRQVPGAKHVSNPANEVNTTFYFIGMSGHNCASDCERGYETLLLTKLRGLAVDGITVQHAITCSKLNGHLLTRLSSVEQVRKSHVITLRGYWF